MLPQFLSSNSNLTEIYRLRVVAWENSERCFYINSSKYPNGWFDDVDNVAKHIIINIENAIVASLRLMFYNSFLQHPFYSAIKELNGINDFKKIGYISRVCVHPSHRNKGLSNRLIDFAENAILSSGYSIAGLDAIGVQAENFKKHGYVPIGELNTKHITWNIEPDNQLLLIKPLHDKIFN